MELPQKTKSEIALPQVRWGARPATGRAVLMDAEHHGIGPWHSPCQARLAHDHMAESHGGEVALSNIKVVSNLRPCMSVAPGSRGSAA
jgi:hypothetical protein